jgi:SRSO17 transposase
VQQLQFFLSESAWDADAMTARTLQLLDADPLTASDPNGVLVIDDTGDRKDGCATDHVARQYLGSVRKIDNGIVAVTTLWANEQRYYPLHVAPYTPKAVCRKARRIPLSTANRSLRWR